MHRLRCCVGVVLLLLLVGISARLLAQEQKSPSHEERAKAVNVIRLISKHRRTLVQQRHKHKAWSNRGPWSIRLLG
jgi:hypothetical protein